MACQIHTLIIPKGNLICGVFDINYLIFKIYELINIYFWIRIFKKYIKYITNEELEDLKYRIALPTLKSTSPEFPTCALELTFLIRIYRNRMCCIFK